MDREPGSMRTVSLRGAFVHAEASLRVEVARREKVKFGRGERIRTSGLYVPNVALYQAKLHPDFLAA